MLGDWTFCLPYDQTASVVASKLKMATGFEKWEKKIDRVERFFSKRRRTALATRESMFCVGNMSHFIQSELQQHESMEISPLQALSMTSPTTSLPNTPPQLFPSPSFLRPTTTRMKAREEAPLTGTVKSPRLSCSSEPRRAQSLPETPSLPHRLPSIDEANSLTSSLLLSSSTASLGILPPQVPKRTSSLFRRRRREPSAVPELLEFSFDQKPRRKQETSARTSLSLDPTTPVERTTSKRQSPKSSRLLDALPIIPRHCPDTPPHSDDEDWFLPLMATSFDKTRHHSTTIAELTPAPSPKMRSSPSKMPAVRATPAKTNSQPAIPAKKHQKQRSLELHHENPNVSTNALRKTVSDSKLSASVSSGPSRSQPKLLVEPTVDDFLTLSDDDIADDDPVAPRSPFTPSGKPPAFGLPPDPPVLPPSSYTGLPLSKHGPLITLKHNLTGRPAAHGAYTCARICKQFGFDLVYVVNLWPANTGYDSSTSSPTAASTPTSAFRTSYPTSPESATGSQQPAYHTRPKLTGRILAAHGLDRVPAPFQIGEPAHLNILRCQGWRKWVSEEVTENDFAEGYAYAFHTGPSPISEKAEGKRPELFTPPPRQRRQSLQDSRGIVFAAYRLPGPDGKTRPMSNSDLDRLFLEAEALVETLLDIHKTQRSRKPSGERASAEETGPLPARAHFEPGLSPEKKKFPTSMLDV